ncbi:unnamed protein product [Cochlearia groenlandica]
MREYPKLTDQKMTTTMVESSKSHLWRSPVPYLFGGLATMLALIAFALLLLACSYWSLSRRSNDADGEKQTESGEKEAVKVFEEKILVIMAGQNKPTFLATPVSAKTCVTSLDSVIKEEIVVNTEDKEGQIRESTLNQ